MTCLAGVSIGVFAQRWVHPSSRFWMTGTRRSNLDSLTAGLSPGKVAVHVLLGRYADTIIWSDPLVWLYVIFTLSVLVVGGMLLITGRQAARAALAHYLPHSTRMIWSMGCSHRDVRWKR